MGMSEGDDTEGQNAHSFRGGLVLTTSSTGSSVRKRIAFDPKGRRPSDEALADAPATFDSVSYYPDQQFTALRARDAKLLAEHIPGPQGVTIFKGRTRAGERQLKITTRRGLVFMDVYRAARRGGEYLGTSDVGGRDANRAGTGSPATAKSAGGSASVTISKGIRAVSKD